MDIFLVCMGTLFVVSLIIYVYLRLTLIDIRVNIFVLTRSLLWVAKVRDQYVTPEMTKEIERDLKAMMLYFGVNALTVTHADESWKLSNVRYLIKHGRFWKTIKIVNYQPGMSESVDQQMLKLYPTSFFERSL